MKKKNYFGHGPLTPLEHMSKLNFDKKFGCDNFQNLVGFFMASLRKVSILCSKVILARSKNEFNFLFSSPTDLFFLLPNPANASAAPADSGIKV